MIQWETNGITFYHEEHSRIKVDGVDLDCHSMLFNYGKLPEERHREVVERWKEYYLMFDPFQRLAHLDIQVHPLSSGPRIIKLRSN